MLERINELKFEASKALEQARAAIDAGRDEAGKVSPEAQASADKWMKEYAAKKQEYNTEVDLFKAGEDVKAWASPEGSAELRIKQAEAEIASGKGILISANGAGNPAGGRETAARELKMKEYASILDSYSHLQDPLDRATVAVIAHPDYASNFRNFLRYNVDHKEFMRAVAEKATGLQMDIDTKGGFTVLPLVMSSELIEAKTNQVKIRQYATKERLVKARKLGKPRLTGRMGKAVMGTELTVAPQDKNMAYGLREFECHPASSLILLSLDLIRYSSFGPETHVKKELSRVESELEEEKFMIGSGVREALGLFTPSNDGIDTSRDISTDANTTGPTIDHHKRVKYALHDAYRANARWLMHTVYILQIALMKDGEGRYQWQESIKAGEPDMYLNHEVVESKFAPNAETTGAYNCLFGDLGEYLIVDTDGHMLRQLDELFALTNEVGFLNRWEFEGAPKIAEAFVRGKNA